MASPTRARARGVGGILCARWTESRGRTALGHSTDRETRPANEKPAATEVREGFLRGAKGTRTPTLTRGNAVSVAVSFRLVPIQYRSLPAVSFRVLTASRAPMRRRVLFDKGLAAIDVTLAGSTATSLNAPVRKAIGAVTDPLSIFAGKPRRQQRSRQSPYPG
jgi:hypothetical protein